MKYIKKILFLLILIAVNQGMKSQNVDAVIQSDAVYFMEGKDSILVYQLSDKSLNGEYTRTNYIHPLYTLDGEILTQDFPEDHPHHRGIFWAWHQLYVKDKQVGDAWDLRDFLWDVHSVCLLRDSSKSKSIQIQSDWKSPLWQDADGNLPPLVRETTTVKVFPVQENYRIIDIQIALLALEEEMRLGGSENAKGYGGFSTRIHLSEETEFTGPQGKVIPENLPVDANGWIDISGPVGRDGNISGLTIFAHPENPGYPNPWILRAAESMQNAVYPYPGATAVHLSDTIPSILRYRLLIHEGGSGGMDIPSHYSGYAKVLGPPE